MRIKIKMIIYKYLILYIYISIAWKRQRRMLLETDIFISLNTLPEILKNHAEYLLFTWLSYIYLSIYLTIYLYLSLYYIHHNFHVDLLTWIDFMNKESCRKKNDYI